MFRLIVLALLVLTVPRVGGSSEITPITPTGNWLLSACEKGGVESTACTFYITGIADTLIVLPSAVANFCPPKGSSYGQAERIVVKFPRDNPQRLHEHRATLAIEALQRAFPCR